jgi:chromate reductase
VDSTATALLEATRILAGDRMEFIIFKGLGDLPLFNPDLEATAPPPVHALWNAVSHADAIVIASPEYAHGVTGTIKNALDWLVGCIPFANMPVAVFNPSHRAKHADDALRETLTTMAAQLIPGACLRIPATACELSGAEMASTASFRDLIGGALMTIEKHLLSQ